MNSKIEKYLKVLLLENAKVVSVTDIDTNYKKLAKIYHPSVCADTYKDGKMFALITEAKDFLMKNIIAVNHYLRSKYSSYNNVNISNTIKGYNSIDDDTDDVNKMKLKRNWLIFAGILSCIANFFICGAIYANVPEISILTFYTLSGTVALFVSAAQNSPSKKEVYTFEVNELLKLQELYINGTISKKASELLLQEKIDKITKRFFKFRKSKIEIVVAIISLVLITVTTIIASTVKACYTGAYIQKELVIYDLYTLCELHNVIIPILLGLMISFTLVLIFIKNKKVVRVFSIINLTLLLILFITVCVITSYGYGFYDIYTMELILFILFAVCNLLLILLPNCKNSYYKNTYDQFVKYSQIIDTLYKYGLITPLKYESLKTELEKSLI